MAFPRDYSQLTAELSRALTAVIKKKRVAKGLSLTKLAELSGLTQTYPGMIEKGDRVPTVDVAHAIARSLPVILWTQRILNLRKHDQPPTWGEMFTHLLLWSLMCKFVGPRYFHIGVEDPWDIIFFTSGGVIACLWWQRSEKLSPPAMHRTSIK